MLKAFQRLFPEVESFKRSWLGLLDFRLKVYLATVIFILGFAGLVLFTHRQYAYLYREFRKVSEINQKLDAVKDLKYRATMILNRCIAAAGNRKTIELGDSVANLDKVMGRLKSRLEKTEAAVRGFKAYDEFTYKTLRYYSIFEIDPARYRELKQTYRQFYGALLELERELIKRQAARFRGTIYNSLEFIGMVLVFLIIVIFIGGWVIITAIKTITEPAALIIKQLGKDETDTNSYLAGITAEGLGAAAFHLKEAELVWDTTFKEFKNLGRRLAEESQDLVAGVKAQEISEVQVFESYKAIDSYVKEQINMIDKANEQAGFLVSNLSSLQRIPHQLKTFTEQIQSLLSTMETRLEAALNAPFQFKDCALEINSLFEDLSFTSMKITEAVSILREVAGQAELLAFNTAIEAAKAGSKGLGFGVVSREIAKLVERSKKAADDLNSAITRVQNEMNTISGLIPMATITQETTISFRRAASEICASIFNTTRAGINDLQRLTQVFEEIIAKSSEIAREADQISNLKFDEKEELTQLDVEILDYQLNVEESVRIASKIEESIKGLTGFLVEFKVEKHWEKLSG